MGLFDKKYCDICGSKIGLFGNRKLEDGNLCKECAGKLSPWFSERRQSTVQEIKEQLAYREDNREAVAAFHTTRTLGGRVKVLLDEDAGKFMVTSARNLAEANPDVLSFADVTGCQLDIDESKTEIEYKDAEGKRQSFSPKCYAYSYDFYIVIHVNHPYFNEIRFQLNDSAVDNDAETLLEGPGARPGMKPAARPGMAGRPPMGRMPRVSNADEVRASVEYRQCEEMGVEIRDAMLQVRMDARQAVEEASVPQAAVTCPWCGATTIPDDNGCCEYCGGAVNG